MNENPYKPVGPTGFVKALYLARDPIWELYLGKRNNYTSEVSLFHTLRVFSPYGFFTSNPTGYPTGFLPAQRGGVMAKALLKWHRWARSDPPLAEVSEAILEVGGTFAEAFMLGRRELSAADKNAVAMEIYEHWAGVEDYLARMEGPWHD